jgi:hypothetical protein
MIHSQGNSFPNQALIHFSHGRVIIQIKNTSSLLFVSLELEFNTLSIYSLDQMVNRNFPLPQKEKQYFVPIRQEWRILTIPHYKFIRHAIFSIHYLSGSVVVL